MSAKTDLKCYTGGWKRTGQDCVIHLPERPGEGEYADRKQFVLGKEISDELLSDMSVPEP